MLGVVMASPLLLRRGVCGEELPHQDLCLGVRRELTGLGPARIASGAMLADGLGDITGELVWGTFSGSPAGAGALVRAAIVDATGVADGSGLGYVLHVIPFLAIGDKGCLLQCLPALEQASHHFSLYFLYKKIYTSFKHNVKSILIFLM